MKPNRRGRKRKTNARRHPGGQIVQTGPAARRETEKDVVSSVLEARQRIYGVPGKAMLESSEIGRLLATGEITKLQFRALRKYRRAVQRYDEAMKAPRLLSGTDVLSKSIPSDGPRDERPRPLHDSMGDSDEYVEWVEYAKEIYTDCQRALRAVPDAVTLSVVDIIAVSDLPCPHYVGALRLGANALVHVFRLSEGDEDEFDAIANMSRLVYENAE